MYFSFIQVRYNFFENIFLQTFKFYLHVYMFKKKYYFVCVLGRALAFSREQ